VRYLLILVTFLTLFGCTPDEVLKVGSLIQDEDVVKVEVESEITDKKVIEEVRGIIDQLEAIQDPEDLEKEPSTIVTFEKPKEKISLIWASIWYASDGTALVKRGTNNDYCFLSKEKTEELKKVLKQK
jgi:hypothetical protein